jgi:hypothetical protein
VTVLGPVWSDSASATYPGRFPLSVERHVLTMADRLLPGVTTVTLNARYYPLHGLVAAEARKQDLGLPAARDLMRRAEVALGAVSVRHLQVAAAAHDGLPLPHGYAAIAPPVDGGSVDVPALAAPGVYARPAWGFWSAYRRPEAVLRIVRAGQLAPGDQFDQAEVEKGLADLLALADLGTLDLELLDDCASLCICQSAGSADGAWLARLLAQPGTSGEATTSAWTRRQTLRVIVRSVELARVRQAGSDLSRFLAYDEAVSRDPVLAGTPVAALWRGLILRNHSVGAWRDLWAWLVDSGKGLTPRSALGDQFAYTLEPQTVGAFMRGLPATRAPDGRPVPAELDPDLDRADWPVWCLSILLLGARRSGELTGPELSGFQGDDPEDIVEELSPAWLAGQADAWQDRPVRDFARWLADVMVNRSQRLALRRATLDPGSGTLRIPARVSVHDGFITGQPPEGTGPASLRLDQLAGVLAGVGLLKRDGDAWAAGPRGDLLA